MSLRQLQIQTRLPSSGGEGDTLITRVPIKGTMNLKEDYVIHLHIKQRQIAFYIGRQRELGGSWYGEEFEFPESLPSSLFENFSIPMVQVLQLDSLDVNEVITSWVEEILVKFFQPNFEIIEENDTFKVQFECRSLTEEKFRTCVLIKKTALKEYMVK